MPSILDQLISDPLTYLVAALVVGGKFYFEQRIRRGVDHRFDEKLESHKQALQLATEQARFEFQKRLADVSLYAAKRHAAAEAVYAAARVAHGHVSNLFGLTRAPSFEEYNDQDLREYLLKREVPSGKQEEVFAHWSSNRAHALAVLRPYLRMLDVQEAERKFGEARNVTYLNELYFSDEAIDALNKLFDLMGEWLSYAEFPREPGEKWRPDRKALNAALERIHDVLRSELSSGGMASATPSGSHVG